MKTRMTFLMAGLMGLFLIAGEASAQSLRDVATAAARVDRSDPDAVREVQIGLRDLGFYEGPIDGIFGQMTYAAAVAAVEAVNAEVAAIQEARTQSLAASVANADDGPSDAERGAASSGFDLAGDPSADAPAPSFGGPAPEGPTPSTGSGSVESVSVGGGSSNTDGAAMGPAEAAGLDD